MRKTVTRCAVIMVALFSIILVSFPLFPSTAGIVSNPQRVDRTLKGNTSGRQDWVEGATVLRESAQGVHWL